MMNAACFLGPATAEAREEYDEHAKEEQYHCGKNGPHACGVKGMGA